jgi:hypothetical protein
VHLGFRDQGHEKVVDHGRLLVAEFDDALGPGLEAMSTMPTAPCTIFCRAAMMASACWRRSMAWAISGA